MSPKKVNTSNERKITRTITNSTIDTNSCSDSNDDSNISASPTVATSVAAFNNTGEGDNVTGDRSSNFKLERINKISPREKKKKKKKRKHKEGRKKRDSKLNKNDGGNAKNDEDNFGFFASLGMCGSSRF